MTIWGLIIGGATGFAFGGPIGALLGAAAGTLAGQQLRRHIDPAQNKKVAFTVAVIALSAKMARADGVVKVTCTGLASSGILPVKPKTVLRPTHARLSAFLDKNLQYWNNFWICCSLSPEQMVISPIQNGIICDRWQLFLAMMKMNLIVFQTYIRAKTRRHIWF